MKKLISLLLVILILSVLAFNIDYLTDKLASYLKHEPKVIINKSNNFYRNSGYAYVQESKDFVPYSKQDLKNIFYSVLNRGYRNFTFYCPSEYSECLNDINAISTNTEILTHINNFVSPFNNFKDIKVIYDEAGEVTIEVNKSYNENLVNQISVQIDLIISKIITDDMEIADQILAVHDYIINNTKYDVDRINNIIKYNSNIAAGPLLEGYGICGGYADAMALFLNKWNVPNFKVASSSHVWNALLINGQWLHLDLTWDDPVNENNDRDSLIHKFYLIDTKTLEGYQISDHDFDKAIYQELAN